MKSYGSSQTDDREDGPDALETQTGQMEPQGGNLQVSCKAGSALLFEWNRNESRPK